MVKRKIFSRVQLLNTAFILLGIVALLSFSEMDRFWEQSTVNQLDIRFNEGEHAMIDEAFVHSILTEEFGLQLGKTKRSAIEEEIIESRLSNSKWIDDAEVYLNNEGILFVEIQPKLALFHIINNRGVQYYVDKNGDSAPVSNIFIGKLLVCSGSMPDDHLWAEFSLKNTLREYAQSISGDPFLEAIVEQIHLDSADQLTLVTSISGHNVRIGRPGAVKKEMQDLSAFYQAKFHSLDWQQVEELDARYEGQVICRLKEN